MPIDNVLKKDMNAAKCCGVTVLKVVFTKHFAMVPCTLHSTSLTFERL